MHSVKSVAAIVIGAIFIFGGSVGCDGSGTTSTARPTISPQTRSEPSPTAAPAPSSPSTPTPSPPPQADGQKFNGYDCTDDCSGHEAGYEWAEENGITDPDDCGGNSDSFIEGCEAYAEEYVEEHEDEYYDDYDDEDYYDDGYYEDDYGW